MKNIIVEIEQQKGYKIGVEILDNYPMSFLHIFNNVREHSSELVRFENDYSNRVYVTVIEDLKKELEQYLSNFGNIVFCEPVIIGRIIDDIQYDDNYYEFVIEQYE